MVLLQRLHYFRLLPKILFPIFIQTHAQQQAIWLIPMANEEVEDDVVENNLEFCLEELGSCDKEAFVTVFAEDLEDGD
jgi:hypothetical protein